MDPKKKESAPIAGSFFLIFFSIKPKYIVGHEQICRVRVIRMIQSTNNKIQRGPLEQSQETIGISKHKEISLERNNTILNIYEKHLQVTSPTYSEDLKELMKKENIEESHLNAKVIETMEKNHLDVRKDTLNIIVNQLQEEHLFKLFEAGYKIEELTVDIIAREIIQSESLPALKDKDNKTSEKDQELEKALTEASLPVTEKNLERLEQFKEKLEVIIEDGDVAIANIIRHQSHITINDLYTAKYRGTSKELGQMPTNEEIIAVLNMNGIKVSQENMAAVSGLIRGNIEITKQSVKDSVLLRNIIKELDSDEMVKNAAREMKKGGNPGDISLGQELGKEQGALEYDELKQIIKDLPSMDQSVIEATYKNGQPITIGNLQQILHDNVETVIGKNIRQDKGPIDQLDIEKVATSKRELEEIRLSLTIEAALKLNRKLDINTTELSKLVEELKIIERQENQELISNVGLPVTEENLDQIETIKQRIYNISQNKELATVQVVADEANFTLEGMDEAIRLKHAQDSYEESSTKAQRRFGETINKVEGQIEHVLEMNQIQASSANIKAAKALIENQIDISKEGIEASKAVMVKIERVLYELKPAVVAHMLKEGIRPDIMEIDQLIAHIGQVQRDKGVNPTQRVAEGILELDRSNQLSPKEREGLLAVYRMLNTITKNETAAIGFLLDNNKEATLGNLFEASKYIKELAGKKGKIDVSIHDALGIREGDLPANIRTLIREASNLAATDERVDQWLNTKNLIDQWLSRITPDQLKKYVDMDRTLEALELKDGEPSAFEIERTTEQIKTLEKVSPQTLSFLKEHNISLSIANIYWTDKMIKNPYLLGQMLEDYQELTGQEIKSLSKNSGKESLEDLLDSLIEEVDEQSSQWLWATESAKAYNMGKELEQMLATQKQLSKEEGIYQIPVQLHYGLSNLNVYVANEKEGSSKRDKDELRAYMSIKTKNLGVIQVNMRISDKALAFEMIGESPQVTMGLQKGSKALRKSIEEMGYKVMEAKFSQGKTDTSMIQKPEASAGLLKYRFEESKFEHII